MLHSSSRPPLPFSSLCGGRWQGQETLTWNFSPGRPTWPGRGSCRRTETASAAPVHQLQRVLISSGKKKPVRAIAAQRSRYFGDSRFFSIYARSADRKKFREDHAQYLTPLVRYGIHQH
ncbi:hypothetical protein BRADI_4g31283v3 [Brachypodium distachyon]|uniref:Uncharacterized protein n=1 Tax=Brachypodium distachyon TaxID=15368 RepID=A0A2K2CRL7_BRADI|nr:hypothetical protein BRADI_4g31283v3 [Brachypodium distachyon]PNT64677.1 hypothetical protein BRADI_4g31283v3 [Brachypodium distachyon]